MIMTASEMPLLSERVICQTLAINRSTFRQCRKQGTFVGPPTPRKRHPQSVNALSDQKRDRVLSTLNSDEFHDQPPSQVYFTLLSRGEYLCSVSTMHRLLRAENQCGERRHQRTPQRHAVPRLHAQKPNEVWTWDITKLATKQRGIYLSLYVVMDLFSRFIVSWMISHKENSALASQLIQQASERYDIAPGQLTLHQDRGSPMTAHGYLDLLGELAITASHSRSRVSNDNAMSEANFKTMKYQPDYPRRFQDIQHAQTWCRDYVEWYNYDHHHSALAGFTPAEVFTGDYQVIAHKRQLALNEAYRQHPNRFMGGKPKVSMPPSDVFINPVPDETDDQAVKTSDVNFPTFRRAIAI